MFQHAYDNYMTHAYPADELMPLGLLCCCSTSLSSLSTLSDWLSTMSDSTLTWSCPCSRPTSGLLAACLASRGLAGAEASFGRMSWYSDQLLSMAVDLATRLLPAFNTSTGISYPRVNLRHGVPDSTRFGRSVEPANLHSNLPVGTVINIHNGDCGSGRRAESGLGIDSYYEYLFKAYVYLHRFSKHYEAAVVQRYNFIRKRSRPTFTFTGPHHLSAPEFIESTYFSIQSHARSALPGGVASGLLITWRSTRGLSRRYAAISDVRTMEKSDQLDSFHRPRQPVRRPAPAFSSSRRCAGCHVKLNDKAARTTTCAERDDFGADDTAFHWRPPRRASAIRIPESWTPNNPEQQAALVSMGIATVRTAGRRQLQLFHNPTQCRVARNCRVAVGLAFMQAMINLAAMTTSGRPLPVRPAPMSVTGESHLGYLLLAIRSRLFIDGSGGAVGRAIATLESLDPAAAAVGKRSSWRMPCADNRCLRPRPRCLFVQKAPAQRRSSGCTPEWIIADNAAGLMLTELVYAASRCVRHVL
uniref:alpha-1,2-Mannosidase n=1 Tax=Macrostomum lignano TaxID=282301 RepID=A0A1I8F7C5_9PLAT